MKPGFSEVAGEEFAPPDLIELETGLREAILNLESLVEQAQCVLEQARSRLRRAATRA